MFHKVKSVKTLDNFVLEVVFDDNTVKYYDVSKLFEKWTMFQMLKENKLFENVRVDKGGYGVSWNDELDLSCNELWENADN